jgi:hypothetical protein
VNENPEQALSMLFSGANFLIAGLLLLACDRSEGNETPGSRVA